MCMYYKTTRYFADFSLYPWLIFNLSLTQSSLVFLWSPLKTKTTADKTEQKTTDSYSLSVSPLTMPLSLADTFCGEVGVINMSTSSSVSSSTASSECISPTVGRVDALVFIRRGRSLQRCRSFGAPLDSIGRSLPGAVNRFVLAAFCGLGGNREASVVQTQPYDIHSKKARSEMTTLHKLFKICV